MPLPAQACAFCRPAHRARFVRGQGRTSTVERFEAALVAFDAIIEARRMFGSPDYEALVRVADRTAYEAFMTQKLTALPGLARVQSRFPMKTTKAPHEG